MAGFDSSFIEELKSKNNIVNVINKYLPLERKGRNHWGRCPFHLEKTPSFCVNEVDQFYHCFGCKASGDVVSFVMHMESISYVDAVKKLAQDCGMQLPQSPESADYYNKLKQQKEVLYNLLKDTAKHYNQNLQKSKSALDYIKNRKISAEMVTRFGIGYSNGFTEILDYLQGLGYTKSQMKDAGVIKEKDGRFYDAIGDRIAFPIIDIYGNVVAFSGRTMQKDATYAKYLNTAETLVFSKSKNLFGINLVKKHKQTNGINEIIIVEGQIDVIALHGKGYNNVVASLGTALTPEQARIIKRLCDDVIICYDGDFAGTKATLRGLDILKAEKLNVRVASLPDKMDPDEIINSKGKEFFDGIINKALPLVEYKLKMLKTKYNMTELDGKAKYLDDAIQVLNTISDTEAEVYLDYISDASGVNKLFIKEKLKGSDVNLASSNLINRSNVQQRPLVKTGIMTQSEHCILAGMLRQKPYAVVNLALSDVFSEVGSLMFKYIANNTPTVSQFANYFTNNQEDVGAIINFLHQEDESLNKQQFEDCLWLLVKTKLLARQEELKQKLKTASAQEQKQIMQEMMQITKKLSSRSLE